MENLNVNISAEVIIALQLIILMEYETFFSILSVEKIWVFEDLLSIFITSQLDWVEQLYE